MTERCRQTRDGDWQQRVGLPAEYLHGGTRDNFEGHHSRSRIAGQPEEERSARRSENERLPGLDENAVEIELRAKVGEYAFDDVVLAGRDATGEQ